MAVILIFGAGNIGRAFIGQVFSKNGYEVVFAEIQKDLMDNLNRSKSYPVVIKRGGLSDESLHISPVRAVSVLDQPAIVREFLKADILATSVGIRAIPHIAPLIAAGILERIRNSLRPIDLILAENIHNGREMLIKELYKSMPPGINIEKELGIVQTSIGKMVPLVTDRERAVDPLLVKSEEYNELILDGTAFINPLPRWPEIKTVHPIEAYGDRKIYIHNLGHAVAAYMGFQSQPEETLIASVLGNKAIFANVKSAMEESAEALLKIYPGVWSPNSLQDHIEDLLYRFQNKSLGDTVFRVGRDLSRKLHRDDRILGAIRNCEAYHLPWEHMGEAFCAAFSFYACDEAGVPWQEDSDFLNELNSSEKSFIILCGLREEDSIDSRVIKKILEIRQKN